MLKALLNTVAAIAFLLLSACAQTPSPQFYLLKAHSKPAAPAKIEISKKLVLGLGPVTLPSELSRPQIVTRGQGNNLQIAELHQWAAPLKRHIPEVLTQNLSALIPTGIIRTYPWSAYNDVQYRLLIDMQRFDTDVANKTAHLQANWSIIDEKNHQPVFTHRARLTKALPDDSYPSIVNSLSDLLNQFSQELASALKNLPN